MCGRPSNLPEPVKVVSVDMGPDPWGPRAGGHCHQDRRGLGSGGPAGPPGLNMGKSLETEWHPGMSPEDKLASPGEQTRGWRVRQDPPDVLLASVGRGGGPHVREPGGALSVEADEV